MGEPEGLGGGKNTNLGSIQLNSSSFIDSSEGNWFRRACA